MTDLIAEDLLLLLLDDERGTTPALWVDVKVPLGAALLAQLALDGDVALDGPAGWWRAPKVEVSDPVPPADPMLAAAVAVVAEKPRTATDLARRLGDGLKDALAARLVEDGVLDRHDERVLGVFPRTRWPAASATREAGVRDELSRVLLQGAEPAPRIAALAGILAALDRVPVTLGVHGAEARTAKRRAKELAEGDWASKAVRDAVAAASAAVTTTAVSGAMIASTST